MKRTALLFALVLPAAGCVERRMTIISDPPGAAAYLDGDEMGTTPVTTKFLFYGGRGIRLEKDGYETLEAVQHIGAPWYQTFPLDLFTDVFLPWTVQDRRYLPYKMEPARPVDKEALVARAKAFRAEAKAEIATERQERRSAEMEQRRAARRTREKEGKGPRKWYRLFF